MALDDDMTTPPAEPRDDWTPADTAEGTMPEGQYLGRDSIADLEADSGADGPTESSGTGADDPTTQADEDPRFS